MRGKLILFIGLTMVVLADVGSGLLSVRVLTKLFNYPESWLLYPLGVVLALALDGDMLITKIQSNITTIEHRDLGHRPVYLLPFLALALVLPPSLGFFAALVFATSFLHLVHDSTDDVNWWGIKWLWPFSNDSFCFLAHWNGYNGRWAIINRYRPSEYARFRSRTWPIMEWFEVYFFRPTPESVGSVVWFLFSVGIAVLWR